MRYDSEKLLFNALRNFSKVTAAIKKEHDAIEEILNEERITAIISDNRYGCYNSDIPSAIVTHQLKFQTGNVLMDRVADRMVRRWNAPFDRIWIPDDPLRTLTGLLSESSDSRVRCIGWQSTLTNANQNTEYDVAAIISGPEPQRSNLEAEVQEQLASFDGSCALVRGVKGSMEPRIDGAVTEFDYLDRNGIDRLMASTDIVICRTGYSSIMDLQSIGKRALLIPTPGQPEQVYLGKRLQRQSNYVVQKQGEINLKEALDELRGKEVPCEPSENTGLLHDAITDFLALTMKTQAVSR